MYIRKPSKISVLKGLFFVVGVSILPACSSENNDNDVSTDENSGGQVSPQETGSDGAVSAYADCTVPVRFIEGSDQISDGETVLLPLDSEWSTDCDSQMSAFGDSYGLPESRSFLDHFHTPGNYSGITYFNYECAELSVGFTENFDTVECELQLAAWEGENSDPGEASEQANVPELENAGLNNRTAIAADPSTQPDCDSQIAAFVEKYGTPELINYPSDTLTELSYQCVLRVVWFEESTNSSCDISGSNVTPEYWGLNPYELIEGC